MIDFTVKTLDSQNHSFSVADDITVKQVKDVIAGSISIPADTVRLIYCGRVLQDEKNLREYNVHGKVIHLVQRAPPQSSLSNTSSTSSSRTNQQRRWTNRTPQMDGNTRYLGTLAIPADLLDAQGLPILQPSHILSRNRLNVARRMIRYMDSLCNRLENPSPENDAETHEEVNSRNNDDADVSDAAEAAAEAIAAAMSAATIERTNQSNSMEESQQQTSTSTNTTQNTARGISVTLSEAIAAVISGSSNARSNQTNNSEESQQTSTSSNASQNTSAPRGSSENANENATASSSETGESRNDTRARPSDLAEVMSSLMRTRDRADVHMRRCMQLLRDDPEFTSRAEIDEAKRVFTGVSALMHHMSHACHALSDIVWVPTTNPPRRLHSSPVLLGQSATLIHSGLPMQQGQLNLLFNRNGNQSQQQSQNSSSNESHTRSSDSGQEQSDSHTLVDSPASGENTSNDSTQTGTSRMTVERTFSLVPANLEFIMEVGPSSITIDALEASVLTNASGNSSNGNGDPNESGIWTAPPQEFMQNLMQAVAGHVMNRASSSTTSTTTSANSGTTTSTTCATNGNSGTGGGASQTSQARGNTATHPTTSTQTRSTSRPHVHFAMQAAAHNVAAAAAAAAANAASGSTPSGAASSLASSAYDPFLSCNSIHLRAARRRRQSSQQQQQANEDTAQQDQRSQEASTPTTGRENTSSRGTQNNTQNSSSTPGQPPIGSLYNLIQSLLGTGAATIGADSTPPAGLPRVVGMVNLPGNPSINVLNLSSAGSLSNSEGSLPVLAHLLQGISDGLGGVGGSNGNTIADLFENLPDHSYTEGESVFADLVMTLARGLTLQDVLAICLGVSNPLNNLRPELALFVRQRLLQNQPTSQALYRSAAERINSELRPYLDMLSEARLREDIDLVGSISRCNIERLPQAMRMILEDTSEFPPETFGARLLTWCQQYGAELCRLSLHCSLDGARGLEPVIRRYVQQLTTGVHPTLQVWTSSSSITHVRNYFQRVINQQVDYERYLVYRAAAPPTPSEPLTSTSTPSSTPNNLLPTTTSASSTAELPDSEPMDTELTPLPMLSPSRSPPPAPEEPVVVTALAPDPERLPEVILGSDPWHHALPSDWVPIIARDAQRQQRQRRTAAVALSDAYLAGMPTKRRKEVLTNRTSNTETGSPSEGTEPMSEDPPTNSSDPSPGARF